MNRIFSVFFRKYLAASPSTKASRGNVGPDYITSLSDCRSVIFPGSVSAERGLEIRVKMGRFVKCTTRVKNQSHSIEANTKLILNANQDDVLNDFFEEGGEGRGYVLHFHDASGQSSNGGTKTLHIVFVGVIELLNRL